MRMPSPVYSKYAKAVALILTSTEKCMFCYDLKNRYSTPVTRMCCFGKVVCYRLWPALAAFWMDTPLTFFPLWNIPTLKTSNHQGTISSKELKPRLEAPIRTWRFVRLEGGVQPIWYPLLRNYSYASFFRSSSARCTWLVIALNLSYWEVHIHGSNNYILTRFSPRSSFSLPESSEAWNPTLSC